MLFDFVFENIEGSRNLCVIGKEILKKGTKIIR